jgi:hypothetical protein
LIPSSFTRSIFKSFSLEKYIWLDEQKSGPDYQDSDKQKEWPVCTDELLEAIPSPATPFFSVLRAWRPVQADMAVAYHGISHGSLCLSEPFYMRMFIQIWLVSQAQIMVYTGLAESCNFLWIKLFNNLRPFSAH